MGHLRLILTDSAVELAREFESINVDHGGIGIMSPKAIQHILRLRSLKSAAANILKQEVLSIGGDCATSRDVILGDPVPQDIILLATRRQLALLVAKLKAQPFGLKAVSRQLSAFLNRSAELPNPLARVPQLASNIPAIMGIINVTTDSFSDGGLYLDPKAAISHGERLLDDGADILDVGGESTRPGSDPVSVEDELARTIPVIEGLRAKTDKPISLDTTNAAVARQGLAAGADWINDVSAGRDDPELLEVVAEARCPYILMHMQGTPKTMQQTPVYDNLMDDLHRFFDERIAAAVGRGVDEENIIIDPGIGFGKTVGNNYEILRRLGEFTIFGRPILVGHSRKSFLSNPAGTNPQERYEETIAAGTIAMQNGCHIIRVHDVVGALKSRYVCQQMKASR